MKITIEVEVDVMRIEDDREPSTEEIASAVEGIKDALSRGEDNGFKHSCSYDVYVNVKSVSLKSQWPSKLCHETHPIGYDTLERLACNHCKGAGCPKCHESGWLI